MGSAPVMAPAVGGFIAQFGSWRLVFVVLAALTATVTLLAYTVLPETLAPERRSPVNLRAAAQTVFGVAGPFLYQVNLGLSAATYGFVALGVGAANFVGAAACGALAQRTTTPRLAIAGSVVLAAAGVVMLGSAQFVGLSTVAITGAAALALMSIGVLDPLTTGLAMGCSPATSV